MEIQIRWSSPIPVRKVKGSTLDYRIDLGSVPDRPGVYIFCRRWGDSYKALYVGKANSIRKRVRSHLNNARLLRHLSDARNGGRFLLAGEIKTKPGQRMAKCLALAERGLMRHYLLEGHDLVNKQGTRIRRHHIFSEKRPRRFVPGEIQIERRKGD